MRQEGKRGGRRTLWPRRSLVTLAVLTLAVLTLAVLMLAVLKPAVLKPAVLTGAAYGQEAEGGTGRADAGNPEQVALGRQVYAEACASCHGEELEGQPNWRVRRSDGRLPAPPHNESGHTWHHPDAMLFGITKFGIADFAGLQDYESDMPAFAETLSDEEIWAAIAYLKSRWPAEIQAQQEGINTRYQASQGGQPGN